MGGTGLDGVLYPILHPRQTGMLEVRLGRHFHTKYKYRAILLVIQTLDPDPDLHRDLHSAFDLKFWIPIRIHAETNADPQHRQVLYVPYTINHSTV
jgi:hypothetical protein